MLELGDKVRIERGEATYEGIIMPSRRDDHMVIKLESGYNIGLRISESRVILIENGGEPTIQLHKPPEKRD
ncbi:MAG: Glu-tRNA(Gln) amidotransferase GatDE subunit D, partial [Methanotrichaceae archaeon]|nr:Glu-tRNA(Gln) amidotransferase GatDE subunit D [Methanotrichaceae archaeon]